MAGLNVIQQAKFERLIARMYERLQKDEGYFAGVPISRVRIGAATITNAKIADGAITTGKIANATIQNAKINDLNASKITTGYLSADRIAAASIVAAKLDVEQLSSITADLGSVSAGTIDGITITGGTIRTASSGSRVEMNGSNNDFKVYDGTNVRLLIGSGAVIAYGDSSMEIYKGATFYGTIDASSSSMNFISSNKTLGIYGNSDVDIIADDIINVVAPTVYIDGPAKTAIIPIDGSYKAIYCAESPDVWFMDFHRDRISSLFMETITGKTFRFECINGKKLAFGKRKGFDNTHFESKTRLDFERNGAFYGS